MMYRRRWPEDDTEKYLSSFPFMDDLLGEDPSFTLGATRKTESEGTSNLMRVGRAIVGGAAAAGSKSDPVKVEEARVVAEGPKDDSAIYRAQMDEVNKRDESQSMFQRQAKSSFGISGAPDTFAERGFAPSTRDDAKSYLTPNFDSETARPRLDTSETRTSPLFSSSAVAEEGPSREAIYRSGKPEYDPEVKKLRDKQKQVDARYEKFQKDWPAWLPIGQKLRSKVESVMGSQVDMARYSSKEAEGDYWRKNAAQREIDKKFTGAHVTPGGGTRFYNTDTGETRDVPASDESEEQRASRFFKSGEDVVKISPKGASEVAYRAPKRMTFKRSFSAGPDNRMYDEFETEWGGAATYPKVDPAGKPMFSKPGQVGNNLVQYGEGGPEFTPAPTKPKEPTPRSFNAQGAYEHALSAYESAYREAEREARDAKDKGNAPEVVEAIRTAFTARYGSDPHAYARKQMEGAEKAFTGAGGSPAPSRQGQQGQKPFEQLTPEELGKLDARPGKNPGEYIVTYNGKEYTLRARR